VASIQIYGQSPSIGRSRKAFALASISSHTRLTWLWSAGHAHGLDRVINRARRDALKEVSWITVVSAFSAILRGSRKRSSTVPARVFQSLSR
jgi:hypothetical protein